MKEKLLKLLYDNAKYTVKDLATMLGVSEAEVASEISALEKEGVICGYKTLLNWEKLSSSYLTALIELKVTPQKDAGFDQIAEKILAFDEVESLYLMSGGFDFTVIVRGDSFQQVAKFVGSCLAPMENVISTATHFVLRRYKEMNVNMTSVKSDDRRNHVILMDYNKLLNRRAVSLKPSGIRKYFDIVETMDEVISLGVGEPDFHTPWHIRRAGIESLENGRTRYTSNWGLAELRRQISGYLSRRFSLDYSPDNEIMVTVGGSEAIDVSLRAIVSPGDEVMIPEPSFVCYAPLVTLCSGTPVILKTDSSNGFKLTAEELKKNITPKTKALILPYPNNPTGAVMTREDLEAIADVLKDTDIFILSDEIYAELTYSGHHVSIASLPGMRERTVVANGFSKAYSMTGWRMGYACGPSEVIKQMVKIHQFAIMSAPTTSQYASIEAIKNGDGDIEKMREEYDMRRKLIVKGFNDIGLTCFEPLGAFYAFPSIEKTGLSSDRFCEELLYKKHVAVIPGTAFGECGQGHFRASYCYSIAHIKTALERIHEFLNELGL